MRPVINATGVLLHTGLGRAPLAREAIEAVAEVAAGYSNLEFDLGEEVRGRRTAGVAGLLRELTGAEAATVVNNNAGATVLALRAMAAGREVIVSRGQLVEIGGSFRLPEIFEVSGARLREVGTTNKTRLSDYRSRDRARDRRHPARPSEQLPDRRIHRGARDRARSSSWPMPTDSGRSMTSGPGRSRPGCPPGVEDEPTAAEGVAAGADLVLFSGDKLLGGPQCGIMVGSREAIGRIEVDPLMRALRVDKMTLAALEVTLRLAMDAGHAASTNPALGDDRDSGRELTARAEALAGRHDVRARAERVGRVVGGVSSAVAAPRSSRSRSAAVAVSPPFPISLHESEAAWAEALRLGDPPVVGRVQKGAVLLDLRTVTRDEEPGSARRDPRGVSG